MAEAHPKATAFLMFYGKCEEAMNLYASLFTDSGIAAITRYKAGEGGPEGWVYLATLRLKGQEFICNDSPIKHAFTFTPAISLYVTCDNDAEIERAFQVLSDGGVVLMPLAAYPFSPKYGWVQDRFGVSWQLSFGPSLV